MMKSLGCISLRIYLRLCNKISLLIFVPTIDFLSLKRYTIFLKEGSNEKKEYIKLN